MSNSVDPDETAHDEPSHLDLRCLQTLIIIAYGSEIVKIYCIYPMYSDASTPYHTCSKI